MEHICKFCGKSFKTGQALGGHVIFCKHNHDNHTVDFLKRKKEKYLSDNPLNEYHLNCLICGKKYAIKEHKKNFEKGKYRHTCSRHCSSLLSSKNTDIIKKNRKISENSKHLSPPNKGKHLKNGQWIKNEENCEKYRIKKCKQCGTEFLITDKTKRGTIKNYSFCCEKCKHDFFSSLAKSSHMGGYVPNSIKKHKHGNYLGIHCDSSWELAFLVYCLEHNIPIKRCEEKRVYLFNGNKKNYFPDFVINNDQVVEIKGYDDSFSKLKREQNKDVLFLFKRDLKEMISYVEKKYGKNFWEILYDK